MSWEQIATGSDGINLITFTPFKMAFKPQDDITPLEAAWCAMLFARWPYLMTRKAIEAFEAWDIIKRHFEVEGDPPNPSHQQTGTVS